MLAPARPRARSIYHRRSQGQDDEPAGRHVSATSRMILASGGITLVGVPPFSFLERTPSCQSQIQVVPEVRTRRRRRCLSIRWGFLFGLSVTTAVCWRLVFTVSELGGSDVDSTITTCPTHLHAYAFDPRRPSCTSRRTTLNRCSRSLSTWSASHINVPSAIAIATALA